MQFWSFRIWWFHQINIKPESKNHIILCDYFVFAKKNEPVPSTMSRIGARRTWDEVKTSQIASEPTQKKNCNKSTGDWANLRSIDYKRRQPPAIRFKIDFFLLSSADCEPATCGGCERNDF